MDEQLKYWLALNKIPVLGSIRIQKLIQAFGDVKNVWEAAVSELSGVEGIGSKLAYEIEAGRAEIDLDDEPRKIEQGKIKVVTLEDSGYPELLKNIYDPPVVLYYRGRLTALGERILGIVGTRRASDYALRTAARLAGELSALGFIIVSGLALGVDTAAHRGALEAGGQTLAVLGSGLNNIYPASNRALAERIIGDNGAVLSEFSLGTPPDRWNFPIRNRIISGLCQGVIVVEGGYDSGSMITAKLALEQGREVFAVPGRIDNDLTRGPHWLIKQGAKLVESIEDILEEFNIVLPREEKILSPIIEKDYSHLSADEQKVVEVLKTSSSSIDQMITALGFPTSMLLSLLTMLEIAGAVKKVDAQRYALV